MDEKKIRSVKLNKVSGSIHCPGYHRYAYYYVKDYGVEVGDVAFKVKFGLVMYRHSSEQPRFELRVATMDANGDVESLECIDPQILAKAIGETQYASHVTDIAGRPHFVGYPNGIPWYNAPLPYHIARSSVGRFLDHHGDGLAVLLVSKKMGLGKVDTLTDARQVLDLMYKVEAFMNEINTKSNDFAWRSATANIQRLTHNRSLHLDKIGDYERQLSKHYENIQKMTEILDDYGMTMENFEIIGDGRASACSGM